VTREDEQAVLVFERKIFRRIFCPKYENGERKSRKNRELEEMSKGENIVKWIKGQRIGWLGHLERMEDRVPQKDLHPRTGRDETKGKTQERMERGSRKRFSSAGSERMERVGDR
jgi:hypothetical protein